MVDGEDKQEREGARERVHEDQQLTRCAVVVSGRRGEVGSRRIDGGDRRARGSLGASGADSFGEKPRGDEAKLPARLAGRGAAGRACTAAGQPDGVVREKRRGGEMGKKKRRGTQL